MNAEAFYYIASNVLHHHLGRRGETNWPLNVILSVSEESRTDGNEILRLRSE
jgi:hypothetical protein